MGRGPWVLLALLSLSVQAADWQFGDAVIVTAGDRPRVFHHLEASGRRSIAVQEGTVAVAWEDNHGGRPQVFVSFRTGSAAFSATLARSGANDAYEPAIAPAGGDRFLVAWEEGNRVWLGLVGPRGAGPASQVNERAGAQITVAAGPEGRLYAAWTDTGGAFPRVVVARVTIADDAVRVGTPMPVDAEPPLDAQLYPTLAVTPLGVTVAWEDRRHGHTRLLYRHGDHDLRFAAPLVELNERPPSQSTEFGRGSGVTRVALAAHGERVAATWMDKREFRGGYDIYAAVSRDGGRTFGANEKVQDLFGENVPQWHPAVAVGPGDVLAVAWDDSRDDAADVWLSSRTDGEWSDDHALPGAHGEGMQSHPVLAFDPEGNLHAAWIHRSADGLSSVRYAQGQLQPD